MNNSTPFFSIVIPTYNHADLIGRCIESLLCQSYQNWEAIIVNNFSEDNTIEVVERYNDPRIRLINNANGGVIAVSRNKGLSVAKGDWICFLDSDDWWYPNKLEVCLQYLDKYDLIYHNLDKNYSVKKSNGKIYGRELHGDVTKDLLVNGNGIPNSSVIIRKKIVEEIDLISEDKNLIAVEDADYWLKASFVTNKFKFINQSLGAYWIGGNISVSEKQVVREKNLFDKYKHLLSKDEIAKAQITRSLSTARIYHKLGMFKMAKSEYLISTKNDKIAIRLKSLIGMIACLLRVKI